MNVCWVILLNLGSVSYAKIFYKSFYLVKLVQPCLLIDDYLNFMICMPLADVTLEGKSGDQIDHTHMSNMYLNISCNYIVVLSISKSTIPQLLYTFEILLRLRFLFSY